MLVFVNKFLKKFLDVFNSSRNYKRGRVVNNFLTFTVKMALRLNGSYIEYLTYTVLTSYRPQVMEFVKKPKTAEQKAKNQEIKKFITEIICKRLMDSFEEWFKWMIDGDLIFMLRKWNRMMDAGGEVPYTVMKNIVDQDHMVPEILEEILDELF